MKKGQNNNKRIYLDYASVTPISPEVLKVMDLATRKYFANPSSLYKEGVEAKSEVENVRRKISKFFGAHSDEIIFTSGGTESDNLAILGVVANYESSARTVLAEKNSINKNLPHIISTNIEHSAVMETLKYLEKTKRAIVTFVPVEKNGIVNPKEIRNAIKKNTILITVMYVNNEIGTIQPITEIAKEIRHYKKLEIRNQTYPIFHTDASQAISLLDCNVQKLGVDMLTCNGGKIHGPRGIGLLYKKRNIEIQKQIYGGSQEFGMRAGTENVPAILGLAKTFEIIEKNKDKDFKKILSIQKYAYQKITQNFPIAILNGEYLEAKLPSRLPSNLNFSFSVPGMESELLVLELDAHSICVSSKSACKSFDVDESYVLSALGISKSSQQNLATIRLSFSSTTTKSNVNTLITSLQKIFQKYEKYANIAI